MARKNRLRGGSGALRVLGLLPFLPLAGRAPLYARLLFALATDSRVPASRKWLLGLAAAYVVSPIDLIPERLPVVGSLDDIAVMLLAVDVFLEGLPEGLVQEKLIALGASPDELDDDLRRVRRMIPKPFRDAAMQIPAAVDGVATFASEHHLEQRLRGLIANRPSIADRSPNPNPPMEESPA
jgi:uncharacterized membrane protein YkvA (DUF1232 family)